MTHCELPSRLVELEDLQQAASCLRVLSHPVRLRMIDILMQGEFPVHRIAALCELPPHQTCEHLRLLQGQGYLGSERRGRSVFYRIADERLPKLLHCLQLLSRNKAEAG
jgi:DNA-binding transcriptional ArsR family regulator